jgi:hypothetical protein
MPDSSWIKPGVEVVVIRGREAHPQRMKVSRVAAQSFTLDGLAERIKLATMESRPVGRNWDSWSYRVVHPESADAKRAFERERVGRLKGRAHMAVKGWMIGGGSEDLAIVNEVIAAFRAFHAALDTQEGGDQ